MQSSSDVHLWAQAAEDPSLYRNVRSQRVRAALETRWSILAAGQEAARRLERQRTLSSREKMPVTDLVRLICEYEAGELDHDEVLGLFSTLVGSELIAIMPFAFQYIAFLLVTTGKIDAGGRLIESALGHSHEQAVP